MRNQFCGIRRVIPVLLFCSSIHGYAQQKDLIQQEAVLLGKAIEKNHYSPRKVDEELCRQIFNEFMNSLDPQGLYFTEADLKELSVYRSKISSDLEGSTWELVPHAIPIYKKRLLAAEKMIGELTQAPFNFSTNEILSFSEDKDSIQFAKDEKALLQRWNKWLKYKTLLQLSLLPVQGKPSMQERSKQMLAKEAEHRLKAATAEKRKIKRILETPTGFENHVGAAFLNAVTSCQDAHSMYLPKTDWENFQAGLSVEGLSFGMDLEEDDAGNITIARLIPGGPAWKSNALHKGDVITELKWEGKEATDLAGADLYEVERMLAASNSEKLHIKVRKTGGPAETVSLVKEKLREDENIVKSFILKGEKKIGYISLPGFYTEWENQSANGCANDVAKAIIRLKQEGVDGLILDIRQNGGGSLQEGANLAGIFINEGPLYMLKDRESKPSVVKDMNRGTIYDGPMVVMINSQSASASELLASTLQDYNRAVIVGSPSFGKATGQAIIPLDSTANIATGKTKNDSQHGFTTITVYKLYRVTGKSAQMKGVHPDVYLPDIYEAADYREAAIPYALPYDSVNKKVFYTPLPALPLKELQERSKKRTDSTAAFVLTAKLLASQPAEGEQERSIPLSLEAFIKRADRIQDWWQKFEKAGQRTTQAFTPDNLASDKNLMTMDAYGKEINDVLLKDILSDIHIEESYRVVLDLIELSK